MDEKQLEHLFGDGNDDEGMLSRLEVRIELTLHIDGRSAKWMSLQASPEMIAMMMTGMGDKLKAFKADVRTAMTKADVTP